MQNVLSPERRIIDAHHHLWEIPGRYYMADECLADLQAGHRVVATVHVEALTRYRTSGAEHLRPIGETQMAAEAARWVDEKTGGQIKLCAGIVAYVDLTLPARAIQEAIDLHREISEGRLRGLRDAATWDADERIVRG